MSTKPITRPASPRIFPLTKTANTAELLKRYDGDAFRFAETKGAIYERHLVCDRAIDPKVASSRERFEAFAHSTRDILAQRWVETKAAYERQNAKRIYYLSM